MDIRLICAHSPQAKGQVERANGALQDRLVKEMRLKKIKDIDGANAFLEEFIESYNRQFGREAEQSEDAHRKLRGKDELERLFFRKERRKLSKDLTFQYEGTRYQIQTNAPNRMRQMYVDVLAREGKEYAYKKWKDNSYLKPDIKDSKELEANWITRKRVKPHLSVAQ